MAERLEAGAFGTPSGSPTDCAPRWECRVQALLGLVTCRQQEMRPGQALAPFGHFPRDMRRKTLMNQQLC
jgi:hypothetical protein